MKIFTRLFLLVALLSFNAQLFASPYEDEVKSYIKTYQSGDFGAMNSSMGRLAWKGISEERVFDPILDLYNQKKLLSDKQSLRQTTTLVKALSYSGNNKYRAIIEKDKAASSNKKLKKHYDKYLVNFDKHAAWNPVIAKGVSQSADPDKQRTINMVNSDIAALRGVGARRISRYVGDAEMVELTKKRLLATYKEAETKAEVDAVANLCKALAGSGNSDYRAVLDQVADDAPNKKVRKYATKFARQL